MICKEPTVAGYR